MSKESLPYDHNYQLVLSISLVTTECDKINPKDHFTESQWTNFGRSRQEAWLDAETNCWANNHIEYGWNQ